jgi:hypothetical protein
MKDVIRIDFMIKIWRNRPRVNTIPVKVNRSELKTFSGTLS